MKILPQKFQQNGFTLTQIKREGTKALYKKTKKGFSYESYELIKITAHNGYTIGGQYISPAETYPGTSLWGTKGWTFACKQRAEKAYSRLRQ